MVLLEKDRPARHLVDETGQSFFVLFHPTVMKPKKA